MKYLVYRTSGFCIVESDRQDIEGMRPCEGATLEPCTYIDERTFKTFEECESRIGERWLDRGTNHRLTKKGIARDFPSWAWFVEISTLDALRAFVARNGTIVMGEENYFTRTPYIEIYDGYRE